MATTVPSTDPGQPGPLPNAGAYDVPPVHGTAAAWVLIGAFVGMAAAWSSAALAPWAGALIGGAVVFVTAVLWIAAHEPA